MLRLAAIGLGYRATGLLKLLMKLDPQLQLTAVVDPDINAVREHFRKFGVETKNIHCHPSAEAMLEFSDQYDGILIGTPCNLHTPMAVKVAKTNLPLFLEKPVSITREQVDELAAAFRGKEDRVVVSFPLRTSPLFQTVLGIIRSGRLGSINQIQAFNYVTYGGVYFGQWYRNYEKTGGMWLQKATHDFDIINALADQPASIVAATETHKIYGGQMPDDLMCSKCDRPEACPESTQNLARRRDDSAMANRNAAGEIGDHLCPFSKSIKNHDSGSALIRYEDGLHASYAQNFVSRRTAHGRGATVTGYLATLRFDWYTDTIQVIDHHGYRVEDIKVKSPDGHFGGDQNLARNFLEIMQGKARSNTDLRSGLLSAVMCLAARDSCQNNRFEPVRMPEGVTHPKYPLLMTAAGTM